MTGTHRLQRREGLTFFREDHAVDDMDDSIGGFDVGFHDVGVIYADFSILYGDRDFLTLYCGG